ncbi:MAG: aldo/keto reductase, partial [Planctomycetes bacterium]|nr:aldo/keto reductase [Planctomycetota bacterium]
MTFLPYRELGRTGFSATRLGIGDLADRTVPLATCVATLQRALDQGLNLVDTAPNYEDGFSEQIVGQALRGRRDGVFVIDKIDHLHAPVAGQLDQSLARLQMDHVDLLVFHACSTLADLDRLQAPGGGFDQLAAEVRRGRARCRGISSHHPDVLRRALDGGGCDVVMFPLGPFVEARYETEVLPRARALGVGTVCFKTFGAGK